MDVMSMKTMIRQATNEDALTISTIHALSWKRIYRGIIPDAYLDELPLDFWQESFERWLSSGSVRARLVLEDARPVGCISFGCAREEKLSGWGEIVSLYLLPDHRSMGYGRMLVDEALNEFRTEGYGNVYLWVVKENASARAFYERMGFAATDDEYPVNLAGRSIIDLRYERTL